MVHERRLAVRASELWAYLTHAKEIAKWMRTTDMVFERRVGGTVRYSWGPTDHCKGTVMLYEPKRTVAYTWHEHASNSNVRWDLHPDKHETALTLRHRDLLADQLASIAAGWHTHLELLEAVIAGREMEFDPRYQELLPQYAAIASRL